MSDLGIAALLIAALFLILGSGVWIGLTLSGVAWIGMQLFSSRPISSVTRMCSPRLSVCASARKPLPAIR